MPAIPKTSFENDPFVQRWLQTEGETAQTKPPFNPTFLSSHHERTWLLSALTDFYEQDLITDVLHVVKGGKEATVYCCKAHPATGEEYLAAKIYRPRMFRSLKNDAVYRDSRAVLDNQGRAIKDRRGRYAATKTGERGRSMQVMSWIQHEYQTQRLLHGAGVDTPCPLSQSGNAILMQYVGDDSGAAPALSRRTPAIDQAQELFDCLLHNIEVCLAEHRVHGDLSAYNILYWNGTIQLIDFAQAVDPRYNPDVFPLLARDIERVCSYFQRLGVASDPAALADDLWMRYLLSDLQTHWDNNND